MTQHITLQRDERRELVLLNPTEADLCILQEAGSVLRLHLINLDGRDADNRITVEQRGAGCETELYGLALTHGTQQVNNLTHVNHAIGGGCSAQLFKYILDGQSRGFYRGELVIARDAQQTSAQQTNRNLLLCEGARMRTMPQLEIYADDVKASHGATTGQLDEHALFYMQQRGIPKEKARQLLLQAFMADVVDSISDEAMRESIRQTIEKQLAN
ncbi:MAG: SufD family Fe-S cluster assembly protein [Paludibacteraceae bacterium]|nr:SufD family Fe-S cluster assembly protein [Paludibacteraceae bacterium]